MWLTQTNKQTRKMIALGDIWLHFSYAFFLLLELRTTKKMNHSWKLSIKIGEDVLITGRINMYEILIMSFTLGEVLPPFSSVNLLVNFCRLHLLSVLSGLTVPFKKRKTTGKRPLRLNVALTKTLRHCS